jgi:hypothetical protein
VLPGVKRPALRRAALATGDAIRSLIRHRALVVVPVLML